MNAQTFRTLGVRARQTLFWVIMTSIIAIHFIDLPPL